MIIKVVISQIITWIKIQVTLIKLHYYIKKFEHLVNALPEFPEDDYKEFKEGIEKFTADRG